MSKITEYFYDYIGDREKFDLFHNEVINMPRDEFSKAGFNKLKSLASYLLLINENLSDTGNNYKDFLQLLIDKYENKIVPPEKLRSFALEKYLNKETLDDYDNKGRIIRHMFSICHFFGLIETVSGYYKRINKENCILFTNASSDIFNPLIRNILININVKNNNFIQKLNGINISDEADYKIAYSILKYINTISNKRDATLFEVSILLGRIDNLQKDEEILKRALAISEELPNDFLAQETFFFTELGWKEEDGSSFKYKNSQQSYFKFKSFIIYMIDFGLLNFDSAKKTLSLTDYSKSFIYSNIPMEILDLDNLLNEIKTDSIAENKLKDMIVSKRNEQLRMIISDSNSEILKEINLKTLRNIKYDQNGKKRRNNLISEIAKFKANYICQATERQTFENSEGINYVEAHHLLEFAESEDNGPDIVENMIILGPEKHKLIHYAHPEKVKELYDILKEKEIIKFDNFKNMILNYNCLTDTHLSILRNKNLINAEEFLELSQLINSINE